MLNVPTPSFGAKVPRAALVQEITAEQKPSRQKRGEPVGSGAIESTCRQMQCRMKRCGQFWSIQGDEPLLCLEVFWRNDYWELLFPHLSITSLSNN